MGIDALIWGTFGGVGLQFLVLVPWLAKIRMGGTIRDKVSYGIKEIALLLPPVLMGSLAREIKTMTDRIFASGLAAGSISFLNYAHRIIELPAGLLIGPIVIVLYPAIDANYQERQKNMSALAQALKILTFLILPVTAGFAILALPITQLIFMRGSFDYQVSAATAFALRCYSPLLIGSMLYQLMLRAHYAIKDTRTPLVAMLISVTLNIVLNMFLMRFLAHGGLALATGIATLTAAVFMFSRLSKVTGPLLDKRTIVDLSKTLLATLVMGAACLAAYLLVLPRISQYFIGRLEYTGGIILFCAGVYFALAWLLKISAMQEAVNLVIKVKQRFLPKKTA